MQNCSGINETLVFVITLSGHFVQANDQTTTGPVIRSIQIHTYITNRCATHVYQ